MWTPESCTATNRHSAMRAEGSGFCVTVTSAIARLLTAVIQTMVRQATTDLAAEDAKVGDC